jgi:hypothetical protein
MRMCGVPLPRCESLCVNRIFLHTHFDRSNCCTVVVLANLRFNFSGLIRAVATLVHACCDEVQRTVLIAFDVLRLSVKSRPRSFTGV